jgi:hypothetical protein
MIRAYQPTASTLLFSACSFRYSTVTARALGTIAEYPATLKQPSKNSRTVLSAETIRGLTMTWNGIGCLCLSDNCVGVNFFWYSSRSSMTANCKGIPTWGPQAQRRAHCASYRACVQSIPVFSGLGYLDGTIRWPAPARLALQFERFAAALSLPNPNIPAAHKVSHSLLTP